MRKISVFVEHLDDQLVLSGVSAPNRVGVFVSLCYDL